MPTRNIPREEAQYRKWGYFFQAAPCRYGHVAPRYTSNFRKCVDCTRLKKGKGTIGEVSGLKHSDGRGKNNRNVIVRVEKPEEVDAYEKRFLEAYAYHKEFKAACAAANVTEAQIESRIAWSGPFKKAYNLLEERMGVKKVIACENYEWTQEKYDKLIEVYINTGDLATARDAIGVTPFEYFQEISRNSLFAARIKEADPLAHEALVERAKQLALAGNDKLLTLVLGVVKPEYKPSAKIEMNVTEKLDDRQLQARLFRLIDKIKPIDAIEGEYSEVAEARTAPAIGTSRGTGSKEESQEDRPVLQYAGSKGAVS